MHQSHPAAMNGRTVMRTGVWTYTLDDIWSGLQDCYQHMAKDVKAKYDVRTDKRGSDWSQCHDAWIYAI